LIGSKLEPACKAAMRASPSAVMSAALGRQRGAKSLPAGPCCA
jgi:hypothetical protein